MFRRTMRIAALALATLWPMAAGAVTDTPPQESVPALKVTVVPVAGSPITIDRVVANRDEDGDIEISADYQNTVRKAITAVRIRFDVYDPFGGRIGYFNGVNQNPLPAFKPVTEMWNGDQPYAISAAIRARVTDVAFADGTYWQAPGAPDPVISAEHRRLLRVYDDGGLKALLQALHD